MTKAEIIKESQKRHPQLEPMNYLQEGQRMGFVEGARWVWQKQQEIDEFKRSV